MVRNWLLIFLDLVSAFSAENHAWVFFSLLVQYILQTVAQSLFIMPAEYRSRRVMPNK